MTVFMIDVSCSIHVCNGFVAKTPISRDGVEKLWFGISSPWKQQSHLNRVQFWFSTLRYKLTLNSCLTERFFLDFNQHLRANDKVFLKYRMAHVELSLRICKDRATST